MLHNLQCVLSSSRASTMPPQPFSTSRHPSHPKTNLVTSPTTSPPPPSLPLLHVLRRRHRVGIQHHPHTHPPTSSNPTLSSPHLSPPTRSLTPPLPLPLHSKSIPSLLPLHHGTSRHLPQLPWARATVLRLRNFNASPTYEHVLTPPLSLHTALLKEHCR